MSLGDITSNERGTGARYNDGKPDFSLIPLEHLARGYLAEFAPTDKETDLAYSLMHLGRFQVTGDVEHLDRAIRIIGWAWSDCARVLMVGAKKYAPWNWAKGMSWSSVIACAGRHAWKVLELDEQNDDETQLPHYGHYMANLLFLRQFVDTYPEGKDLAPPEFFAPPSKLQGLKASLIVTDDVQPTAAQMAAAKSKYVEIPIMTVSGLMKWRMTRERYDMGFRPRVQPDGNIVEQLPWEETGHGEQATYIRAAVPRTPPADDHLI